MGILNGLTSRTAGTGRRLAAKKNQTVDLVFIHGPAAAGKLTIARELTKLVGLPVFHNQLVVDALTPVFEFGSPAFVNLREQIWLAVFKEAARAGTSLIFTFVPEKTVTQSFVREAVSVVQAEGGRVLFVELTCPVSVQEERVAAASRAEFGKIRSVQVLRELRERGAFNVSEMPSSGLKIDTSVVLPQDAAKAIVEFFGLTVR
jgi:chloramphenicol 3-O-phosphotransferase